MNDNDELVLTNMVLVAVGGCISYRVVSRPTFPNWSPLHPANTVFMYLKIAIDFFCLSALLHTVYMASVIVRTCLSRRNSGNVEESAYYPVFQVLVFCAAMYKIIFERCELYVDILIGIILLRLITAIFTVHSGSTGLTGKIIQFASNILSCLLVSPAVIRLGFDLLGLYASGPEGGPKVPFYLISEVVNYLLMQLVFATSISIIAGAFMVTIYTRAKKCLTWASTTLVAASLVWMLHLYGGRKNATPAVDTTILEVVFGTWSQFVILMIVYFIRFPEANGIRSRRQNSLAQTQKGK